MAKPKRHPLPPWIKGATSLVRGILTINSINAVGVDVRGAGFSYKLTYQQSIDRWLQGRYPLGGFPGTSLIEVNFTFKNTGPALSGYVTGSIDQTTLTPFQAGNLVTGQSVSGVLSFHPLNVLGDHSLQLQFRQPLNSPFMVSIQVATASATYFVY